MSNKTKPELEIIEPSLLHIGPALSAICNQGNEKIQERKSKRHSVGRLHFHESRLIASAQGVVLSAGNAPRVCVGRASGWSERERKERSFPAQQHSLCRPPIIPFVYCRAGGCSRHSSPTLPILTWRRLINEAAVAGGVAWEQIPGVAEAPASVGQTCAAGADVSWMITPPPLPPLEWEIGSARAFNPSLPILL